MVAAATLFAACSKDQKVVNQLEGTWSIESVTIDGVADTTDYSNDSYTFEKCKVKNGDCPGTLNTTDPTKGEVSYDFTYRIEDDGTTLVINLDVLGFVTTTTATISENSDDRFTWTETNEAGQEVVTTITKN